MLSNLPTLYRKDPWIVALATALGGETDAIDRDIRALPEQLSLDTVSWNLAVEERMAGLTPAPGDSEEQRRAALKAKWRSGGKVTRDQVQRVADSWRNGAVEVGFENGSIVVQFVGEYGVPADITDLQNAIALVIPAHLSCEYRILYLLIRDIHGKKTLSEMNRIQLNQFAGGAS